MSLDIRAGMAQGGADPCHKLRGAERLCNIIVSTTVQSRYLILLLGPGGNDDNWSGGPAADAVQHIQPVHIRKSQIQKDHVGTQGGG